MWHCVHVMVAWKPTSVNTEEWTKVDDDQLVVVWQVEQSAGKPTCDGVALAKAVAWQEEQAVGVCAKLLPAAWHEAQGTLTCAPVSGNGVLLWLKVAVVQVMGAAPWQVVQSVGKVVCGGLLAPWKSDWWQLMQVAGL